MKQENNKQVRNKSKQKRKRHRKNTMQKLPEGLTQTIEDYVIHLSQVIGEGTYGKVYKTSKIGSDQSFACKFIKKDRIDDLQIYYKDKKMAQQLQNRLITQGQFQLKLSKCPYIARMYKTIKNQKGFYFIMEYCESDLAKLLKKEGILTQEVALRYFKQIVEGIKFIYEKNAFHRDLKPQNLLLKDDTIKISDFGFVKIFTQIDKQCKSRKNRFQTQSKVGTFRYMSPDILTLLSAEINQVTKNEQIENLNKNKQQTQSNGVISLQSQKNIQSKYNPQKSDVWSLGIILYKMLYGKQPYDGRSFEEMIKKIKQQKPDFPGTIQLPPGKIVKVSVSKNIIKLIKRMLVPDQNERIDFLKLYSKLDTFLTEREKQKNKSGIQQNENQKIKTLKQQGKNKKQRLLAIYNKIMVRIYKDLSTFATLREIGIQNYSQFSYKIMTLLHQKRTAYLEQQEIQQNSKAAKSKNQNAQIDQKVKQQISQYHNVFYQQIKNLSNLKSNQTLQNLLLIVYQNLQKYQDFEMLIKEVQLFLLFLLQLLCLEMKIIKQDYICATEDKAQTLKIKSILNFKNDALKLIKDRLKFVKKDQNKSKSKERQQKREKKSQKSKQKQINEIKRRKQKSVKKQKSPNSQSKNN